MTEPRYRYALKGKIFTTGHKSIREFARKVGIPEAKLSCIIRGFEYPRQRDFRAIAQGLNITNYELEALL